MNKLMLESDFYFSMNVAGTFYLALVIKNKISEEKKSQRCSINDYKEIASFR